MKKVFIGFFIAALMTANVYAAPNVSVDGKIIDTSAIIENGRTLVPVRGVFESLGYSVDWNSENNTATISNDINTVTLKNGDTYFTVNNEKIVPDVPQQIINSRFYLPLRAVADAVGAYVSWDKGSETAVVNSKEAESVFVTSPTPGVKTIKNLLLTSLMPVGKTMYIYGGGWNEEDTGSGIETVTIGLSDKWQEFYDKQNSSYNYKDYNYKKDVSVIHLGLDCSGFVGWSLYNTINSENNLEGFVASSKKIAGNLSSLGWGTLRKKGTFTDYRAGDILSASCTDCAHVWICIGQCDDGSVVFVHSSPPGVSICGTYTPSGNENSKAINLAREYMSKYYPNWYNKFPEVSRNQSYLSHYDRFRWVVGGKVSDPCNLTDMSAEEVLKNLFNEQ
ncbi:MAG: copper amine oxidase N-terminal domain-containing protein [Lachnospirales bacterium]